MDKPELVLRKVPELLKTPTLLGALRISPA
jgi:hypothetical protein